MFPPKYITTRYAIFLEVRANLLVIVFKGEIPKYYYFPLEFLKETKQI